MFVPKFLQTLQSLPKIRILLISVPQSKISKRVDKKANKSWNKWKSISVLILRAKVRHPNKKGLGRAKGVGTGKSLSKELILASTNPQHDKRLFIELRVHYMKTIQAQNMLCTWIVLKVKTKNPICVHNMFWTPT